jgi:hypothetical protein
VHTRVAYLDRRKRAAKRRPTLTSTAELLSADWNSVLRFGQARTTQYAASLAETISVIRCRDERGADCASGR